MMATDRMNTNDCKLIHLKGRGTLRTMGHWGVRREPGQRQNETLVNFLLPSPAQKNEKIERNHGCVTLLFVHKYFTYWFAVQFDVPSLRVALPIRVSTAITPEPSCQF
jgi:hypothetical protein